MPISITFCKKKQEYSTQAIDKIDHLLNKFPAKFYRVTGSTRADTAILHNADYFKRDIISNDTYSDHAEEYPWIKKHTNRLIQCNLQPSGLMTIDKLRYGRLTLQTDVEAAFLQVSELLSKKTDNNQEAITSHIENKRSVNSAKNVDTSETNLFAKQRKTKGIEEIRAESLHSYLEATNKQDRAVNTENNHEQECINKANKALSEFLRLQICNPHIQFSGGSWNVAIKRLEILFGNEKICTHCYHLGPPIEDIFDAEGIKCRYCQQSSLTTNPIAIWEVIEGFSPDSKAKETIRKKIDSGTWRGLFKGIAKIISGTP